MLTKYLDPKNDIAFKKIFGTEKNKDILVHFLNDMITFKGGSRIQEVTFLKPNQDPETIARKTSIVDILCKDENELRDFSFTFLELPKFNKDIDHLSNMTEKWAYFFKHAEDTSENDLHKIIGHDQIIERAYSELNRFAWNEQEI